jgi:hypothetical protein
MINPRLTRGFWRGYLLGLITLALLALVWQAASQPPPAYGQVPDSGAQRNRMIQELVTSNTKLTQIVDLLKEIRDLNKGESATKKPVKRAPTGP